MQLLICRKAPLLAACVWAVALAPSHEAQAVVGLTIGDTHELGTVEPDVPEGDHDITQYVNAMINLPLGGMTTVSIGPHDNTVTRSLHDFGPLPTSALLVHRDTGTDINLGALGMFEFLFAHYGGPQGGEVEVWFVGDLGGEVTIPGTGFDHNLSGWALFKGHGTGVPDGGPAVALLGIGLGVIEFIRRKLRLR